MFEGPDDLKGFIRSFGKDCGGMACRAPISLAPAQKENLGRGY